MLENLQAESSNFQNKLDNLIAIIYPIPNNETGLGAKVYALAIAIACQAPNHNP